MKGKANKLIELPSSLLAKLTATSAGQSTITERQHCIDLGAQRVQSGRLAERRAQTREQDTRGCVL